MPICSNCCPTCSHQHGYFTEYPDAKPNTSFLCDACLDKKTDQEMLDYMVVQDEEEFMHYARSFDVVPE